MQTQVPTTISDDARRALYIAANDRREEIKHVVENMGSMRAFAAENKLPGEAQANLTIAYRAMEDASMRLGKVLQALDGGVSVYDKDRVPEVREIGTPRVGHGG